MKRRQPIDDTLPATADPRSPLPAPPAVTNTLADIRNDALVRVANSARMTAETIADLESWRAEIDATIAFLKAQRR